MKAPEKIYLQTNRITNCYNDSKPAAWSEEDEVMVEDIIEAIDTQYAVSDYNEMVLWLKSLKERMA